MEYFDDQLHRIAYATDASVYREMPCGVAFPKCENEIRELLSKAKTAGVDIIPRAAGTSVAGQVVGSGIVVDISRHMNSILEVNQHARWARVQPGVVRDELNKHLRPMGLFFSPETSTSNRCCIGGMFGNNSCGTHSLVYGSTRQHIIEARGMLSDGSFETFKTYSIDELEQRFGIRFWTDTNGKPLIQRIYSQLINFALNPHTAQLIADNYPDAELKRRSCGYAIDEAIADIVATDSRPLGKRTINLCRLLAGSEGTLAFITEIKVALDPLPEPCLMVVCAHCSTLQDSYEANLVALSHQPAAIELMDSDIIKLSKANAEALDNQFFIEGEPAALLMIELRSDTPDNLNRKAEMLEEDLLASKLVYRCTKVYNKQVERVWALRKAGLGVLGGMKGDARPHGVIEDTAVAPIRLPQYLKEFREMLEEMGKKCVFYGHISTGELHLRPILNLKDPADRKLFRTIAEKTTLLVKKHRGTISGEHGDGRLRGEFIRLLYGNETYKLMRQVKQCWDSDNVFNRHKIVDTKPMDSSLRYEEKQSYAIEQLLKPNQTHFDWKTSFDQCSAPGSTGARSQLHALMCTIEQCNGAADCRKSLIMGGNICPTYKLTLDETMTTRGRANIFREILTRGGDARLVKEVADSCLACKACRRECPSNVDMTRLRAELLQHYYDHHGMPMRTKLIANAAKIENFFKPIAPVYNVLAKWKPTSTLVKAIIGFTQKRPIPPIKSVSMKQLVSRELKQHSIDNPKKHVCLLADEFTNNHEPQLGLKFAQLLLRLGYSIEVVHVADSGRAALSKGNLKRAKHTAEKNVRMLRNVVSNEAKLVGIEPSCILSLRDEYPDLVGKSLRSDAELLASNSLLYDEFLCNEIVEGNISSNYFSGKKIELWLHGHCHQKSLVGIGKTVEALKLLRGATLNVVESPCCGMAGAFGYEKEHFQTSMAIGEMVLFPTLRKAMSVEKQTATMVLAPGTSCRQQIKDGTGISAHHPIELLWSFLLSQ